MWRITADKGDNKLAHITFYYIVFVHVYQMLLVFGTKSFTSDQLNFLSRVLHLRSFQFLTDWSGKPAYSVDSIPFSVLLPDKELCSENKIRCDASSPVKRMYYFSKWRWRIFLHPVCSPLKSAAKSPSSSPQFVVAQPGLKISLWPLHWHPLLSLQIQFHNCLFIYCGAEH